MEVKVYSLWKNGTLMYVGTVSQISNRFNIEPRNIYQAIKWSGDLFGMKIRLANGEKLPSEVRDNRYEAKPYRDSSSRRFTPL